MRYRFHEVRDNDGFWKSLATWWASLEHDRGQRAALRRADSPEEIRQSPAFWRGPASALERDGFAMDFDDLERLALPIGVLAHAKELAGSTHTARLLGQLDKGGQSVRDVRFRRLLAVADDDRAGLYTMLIRLTRLLGGRVALRSLVCAGFAWNDAARRDWARQYYTAPTPTQND